MMGTNDSSGERNMQPSSTPEFAFLLLKEHPYGREMLSQLLSENFIPSIIISEDSSIGDEEREKFLKRIEGNPVAPTIESRSPSFLWVASLCLISKWASTTALM